MNYYNLKKKIVLFTLFSLLFTIILGMTVAAKCSSEWQAKVTDCQPDNTQVVYYTDTNECDLKSEHIITKLEIIESFSLNKNAVWSLTYDGEFIWALDDTTDIIYKMDKQGRMLESFSSPDYSPVGIAWDEEGFWIASNQVKKIYRISKNGTILQSFDVPPGTLGSDIEWYDGYVWLLAHTEACDHSCGIVYKLNTEGKLISAFPAPEFPNYFPIGLLKLDDKWLFAETNTDSIYITDDEGTLINSFPTPGSNPVGLTWDEEYLWLSDSDTDKLYKIQIIEENPAAPKDISVTCEYSAWDNFTKKWLNIILTLALLIVIFLWIIISRKKKK